MRSSSGLARLGEARRLEALSIVRAASITGDRVTRVPNVRVLMISPAA